MKETSCLYCLYCLYEKQIFLFILFFFYCFFFILQITISLVFFLLFLVMIAVYFYFFLSPYHLRLFRGFFFKQYVCLVGLSYFSSPLLLYLSLFFTAMAIFFSFLPFFCPLDECSHNVITSLSFQCLRFIYILHPQLCFFST